MTLIFFLIAENFLKDFRELPKNNLRILLALLPVFYVVTTTNARQLPNHPRPYALIFFSRVL